LIQEGIVAEPRIVVGVRQEKEQDSQEKRRGEKKSGLAQKRHFLFDSTRKPRARLRCYRFGEWL
jgi:hypothetical protein